MTPRANLGDDTNVGLRDQDVLSQRRRAIGTVYIGGALLVATMLFGEAIKPGVSIWIDLTWDAVFGGLAAITVACLVVSRSQKPLVLRDFVRITCWVVVGASLVVGNSGHFYFFYWPQYASMVRGISGIAFWVGVCTLLLASFVLPVRIKGPGPDEGPG